MEVDNKLKGLGQCCCRCSTESRGGFKKIMDCQQGVVVYQLTSREVYDEPKTVVKDLLKPFPSLHVTTEKDVCTKVIEKQTDNTVIVIHNTNDDDIFVQSAEFFPEFDINTVSCPRCRYIMSRAKKLLASVPVVKKKDIRCVCDLCVLKQLSRTPCHVCQSAIKQFEATGIKGEPLAENIKKKILTYLTNAKRILRTDIKSEERKMIRSFSYYDITQIVERRDKYSKRLSRPKSSPVFDTTVKYVSDQELPNIMLQKKRVTIKKETSIELSKNELLVEEMYQKGDKDEKFRLTLKPVLKTTTEAQPSQQQVPIFRRETKTPYRSGDVTKSTKSETILGIGTTGVLRRSHSDESMITSFTGIREEIFKKNFKYFFPRVVKKEMDVIKTMTDVIQESDDKLFAEAEEKQMKRDEIQKRKNQKEQEKEISKEELKRKIMLAKQHGIIPLDDNKSYEIDKKTGLLVEKINRGHISKKRKKSLDDLKKDKEKEKRGQAKISKSIDDKGKENKIKTPKEKQEERKEKRGERKGKQELRGKKKFKIGSEKQGVITTVSKMQETEKQRKETGVKVELHLDRKRKQATGQKVSDKAGVKVMDNLDLGEKITQATAKKVSDKAGVKVMDNLDLGQKFTQATAKKVGDKAGVKVMDNLDLGEKITQATAKKVSDKAGVEVMDNLDLGEKITQATAQKAGDNVLQSKEQQDKDEMTDAKVESEVITEDHLVDERKKSHEKGYDKLHLPNKGDRTVDKAKAKAVLKTKNEEEEEDGKGKVTKEHIQLLNKVLDKHDQSVAKHHKLKPAENAKLGKLKKMSGKENQNLKDEPLSHLDGNLRKKTPSKQVIEKGKPQPKTPSKQVIEKGKPQPTRVDIKDIKIEFSGDDLLANLIKINIDKRYTASQKSKPVPPLPMVPRKTYHTKAEQAEVVEEEETISEIIEPKREESELVFRTNIIKKKQYIPPEPRNQPALFQNVFNENRAKDARKMTEQQQPATTEPQVTQGQAAPGAFRYQLSDRKFIDNGWTLLPEEKIIRKMNIYRMRPVRPEFDWFEHNTGSGAMFYDTGERMADFDQTGHGRWYYKNGRVALDYYDCEESNAQQRFVIYSSGEPDDRGRTQPITVLGMFDYTGNGIVFDHQGKIRLKYNQSEGVVLDRGIGPISHWKWHSLNDPPELQQVMIDTQLIYKDPDLARLLVNEESEPRVDDEEMVAIEFQNYVKSTHIKPTEKFQPYQIKMKAMKINEQFSLRVLDQKTIYLHYRDGLQIMKLNLGMELDHNEIIDTGTCELGEVTLNMENRPAVTESIENLQKSLINAHGVSRVRAERELLLKPLPPGASADKLTAAISRPLRPPLRPTDAHNRISSANNNVYYNTRLI